MTSHDRAREMVAHLADELQHGTRVLAADNHALTNTIEIARALETDGRVILQTPLPREAFREIFREIADARAATPTSPVD